MDVPSAASPFSYAESLGYRGNPVSTTPQGGGPGAYHEDLMTREISLRKMFS